MKEKKRNLAPFLGVDKGKKVWEFFKSLIMFHMGCLHHPWT
jgi:hypothetical protein